MAGWFLPIRTPPRHRAAARRTLFLREWHPLNHTPPQPERMDSSHPAVALARTVVGKRSLMKISVGAVHLLPDRRLLKRVEDKHAERRVSVRRQRTSRANPRCRTSNVASPKNWQSRLISQRVSIASRGGDFTHPMKG